MPPDPQERLLDVVRATDRARREAEDIVAGVRHSLARLEQAEARVASVRGDLEGLLTRGGKVIDLYFRLRLEQERLLRELGLRPADPPSPIPRSRIPG